MFKSLSRGAWTNATFATNFKQTFWKKEKLLSVSIGYVHTREKINKFCLPDTKFSENVIQDSVRIFPSFSFFEYSAKL